MCLCLGRNVVGREEKKQTWIQITEQEKALCIHTTEQLEWPHKDRDWFLGEAWRTGEDQVRVAPEAVEACTFSLKAIY